MPSSKPTLGVNDLQTKFPDIAAEANGWDPATVLPYSRQKKSWRCNLGHIWDAKVSSRTSQNAGCLICSNKQVLNGFNDLKTKFPDIAAEANGWDPETVIAGSHQKMKWVCSLGHTWNASISQRTFQKTGCPICSGRQVYAGFNDLQTKFPEIAAEANGWDPATVTTGSGQKKSWRCNLGHTWDAKVSIRTSQDTGCPVCSNNQFLVGFNDLKTKFPDIAAEANGWDPSTVTSSSRHKKNWVCSLGHTWNASISQRTFRNSGCPICSGKQVNIGFNDLQTKFPDIAAEAIGWDPSTVTPSSGQKKNWVCSLGHTWNAAVYSRTQGNGCPVCSNKQLHIGFNDLQTKFPDIAAEANGWDPATVTAGSHQKKKWVCNLGHTWDAVIVSRTLGRGCPVCSNQKLLAGFNDLQTKFPGIAAQANGWDPATVTAGSTLKRNWICDVGHTWDAQIRNRVIGKGCPTCAEYGFNSSKDAWFYLMYRAGEQQIGITNDLETRLRTHERNGWVLLEHTEPASGQKVLDTENAFKMWLKKNIGVMEGTTENWSTTSLEVQSLAELKKRSGIETDLF